MRIIEIESTVDRQGKLTIPAHLLGEMGIVSGDTVRLAYISKSSDRPLNTYSEFIITPNGIVAALSKADSDAREFGIPNELLEAANIPFDSDIEIVCTDGAIIITGANLLDTIPDELYQMFVELDISPEAVRTVLMSGGSLNE